MTHIVMLKVGITGDAVTALQTRLTAAGFVVFIDGEFGPTTERAVIDFQLAAGLIADGIVGIKTNSALANLNTERYLKHSDIITAANALAVPIAAVYAINEIESRGTGFNADDSIVVLFERHIMHKRMLAHGIEESDVELASSNWPNLVNKKSGDYMGGTSENYRLKLAKQIHPQAAPESCSYGLFQIMGYHWKVLGYNSITEFVNCMEESEGQQLEAFTLFIQHDAKLHSALKNCDWAEFAKRYNGKAYKKNQYDIKLANAFDRYQTLHPTVKSNPKKTKKAAA